MGRNPQNYQSVQPDHSVQDSAKDMDKNKAFPSRTYHTIKDMISSRFGNGKVPKDSDGFSANDKMEASAVPVLNNTTEASAPNRRKDNAEDKQNRNFPGEVQGVIFRRDMGEGVTGGVFHNPGARRDIGEGLTGAAVFQSAHIPTENKSFSPHIPAREGTFHNTHTSGNLTQGLPLRREGEVISGATFHVHGRREVAESFQNQQQRLPPRTLEQAGIYMVMRKNQPPRPQTEGANYGSPNTVGLAKQDEEDDDDGGFIRGAKTLRNSGQGETIPGQQQSSGQSSDYEKATQRSNADSGRGSTVYSSGHQMAQPSERLDTSTESSDSPQVPSGCREGIYSGLAAANDSEWVDIVESELRQILDPKLHGLGRGIPPTGTNSTLSESISSMSPPLPPLSPGGGSSPSVSPQHPRYKHSSR